MIKLDKAYSHVLKKLLETRANQNISGKSADSWKNTLELLSDAGKLDEELWSDIKGALIFENIGSSESKLVLEILANQGSLSQDIISDIIDSLETESFAVDELQVPIFSRLNLTYQRRT